MVKCVDHLSHSISLIITIIIVITTIHIGNRGFAERVYRVCARSLASRVYQIDALTATLRLDQLRADPHAFVRVSDAAHVAQCDVGALLTFVRVDVLASFTAWRYAARADKWRVGSTALSLVEAALSGGTDVVDDTHRSQHSLHKRVNSI